MSLLRRIGAGEDAKSIRARIPADLADALDAFDRDAKRQGFEFPRDDIVADALRKALAKARAELDKLAGNDAAADGRGGSEAPQAARPSDAVTAAVNATTDDAEQPSAPGT